MNEIINLLLEHRSIRKFTDRQLTEEQLHTIIAAGQQASTSSNMQAYSIIRVTDRELREQFASLSGGQMHVVTAPEFLVWCGDLSRIQLATNHPKTGEVNNLELTENFIISTVDAALAAQNSAIAAESMGLGILYVGGIRNDIVKASELLKLPSYVYPLFGMCIGYPAEQPILRPRLPLAAVLHENCYNLEGQQEAIAQYDETMTAYVKQRSQGKQQFNWTDAMGKRLEGKQRDFILSYLQGQGLLKK